MSADVTDDVDRSTAYCPVCTPVYAGTQYYQRYAVPQTLNNACCRGRPNLDVFRPSHHSPDLLSPLADTTAIASVSTLRASSTLAVRAVSCSAPDLIELSSRLPVDQEPEQDVDVEQVRCVTSFPGRHVSQSTAVVCGQASPPTRDCRWTVNDQHSIWINELI